MKKNKNKKSVFPDLHPSRVHPSGSQACIGIDYDVPYCENPAIGLGAPRCSELCCTFDSCTRTTKMDYINKNNFSNVLQKCPECGEPMAAAVQRSDGEMVCAKCAIMPRIPPSGYIFNNKAYTIEELEKIVQLYEKENQEDCLICSRCGLEYSDNSLVNLADTSLREEPKPGECIGYADTPYVKGFQVLSTCGNGKKLNLCDNCVNDLTSWFGGQPHKHGYWTGRTFVDDAHSEGFPMYASEEVKAAIRESDAHATHCSVCGAMFDDRYIKGWKGCPRCLSILDLKTPPNAYSLAWESKRKDLDECLKNTIIHS